MLRNGGREGYTKKGGDRVKFRVTTSEVISKTFEIEAENEDKARAVSTLLDCLYKEVLSVKTTSWEITNVEEIK